MKKSVEIYYPLKHNSGFQELPVVLMYTTVILYHFSCYHTVILTDFYSTGFISLTIAKNKTKNFAEK